ncbi:uncharacterized protein LOC125707135 isoform X3 [Brienomyrus brachyistius]|uniref:uncharacterized protein LOC125707135 isoform X3 n=1 Tax=Brienomyrus brachyistius TaxID=42636 RepID=UPI0020B3B525|nr:uncharacterized protein LOC125707135 isoform X3 [Brienomyrus brachyistius]
MFQRHNILLIFLWVTGLSLGNKVNQSPPARLVQPNDPAEISCSHEIPSYNIILWYQQQEDNDLKLIGKVWNKDNNTEDAYKINFEITGDGTKEAFLHIPKVLLSAVCCFSVSSLKGEYGQSCHICSHFGFREKGHGEDSGVTQNPNILWAPIGTSAQMNCSHNKGVNYNQMYWYHQRPGENIQLIVFTVVGGKPDFGNLNQSNYEVEKLQYETGSFSVKNMKPEDSGVYFCAVSQHSDAG